MSDSKMMVQCFYNFQYNKKGVTDKHPDYSWQWGFGRFDLAGKDLSDQLLESAELDEQDVSNLNLVTFTPFPDSVFEEKV